jgi:excisionase family DNA binding protein
MSVSKDIEALAVSFSEAARIAGLSERTLRRSAADGRLTIVRVGRATRVLLTDLKQWLDDQRRGRLADFERSEKRKAAERAAAEAERGSARARAAGGGAVASGATGSSPRVSIFR